MNHKSKLNRSELDDEIAKLAASMPSMLETTNESSHMDAFAGQADQIRARASDQDQDYLWSRLQCILRDNEMLPGDDETCSM